MGREVHAHHSAGHSAHADIRRQSIYFEDGRAPLFGWLHTPATGPLKDCAAVLCPPLGYEYIHSHRSLRHLADHLARHGIPALRFDYHGTGDSPGDDLEPDRLACWEADIRAALTQAAACSGCRRVCLIGLRLGATLAALVAGDLAAGDPADAPVEVPYLVLWDPCVRGRQYVREMQALALLSAGDATPAGAENRAGATEESSDGVLESAGFALTAQTVAELKAINLLKLNLQRDTSGNRQILVLGRDDLEPDPALPEKLRTDGIATDYQSVPGFADMMAEPQFTVVPAVAINTITDWLTRRVNTAVPATAATAAAQTGRHLGAPRIAVRHRTGSAPETLINEQPCHFGRGERLFGILSYREQPATGRSAAEQPVARPAVVLSNAGSVHHVGPNRIYVELARSLSALGYTCLRMDLEGLGDSIASGDARENHPYPETAVRDTEAALGYLSAAHGCRRFIVVGLCSGAHTAFHAGVELAEHDIVESILINPLTFRWQEGMSLETTQSDRHFQDVAYYRHSARDVDKWKKLLKGQVKLGYLAGVALSQSRVLVKSHRDSIVERLRGQHTSDLSAALGQYFDRQRQLSLFVSSTDPGYDVLLAGARNMVRLGLKDGKIKLKFIPDADHTFTRRDKRRELVEAICHHVQRSDS